jgi:outer membrane lipoprotein-sorting protein
MRTLVAAILSLGLLAPFGAEAYDIEDLVRDGRAHHQKAQQSIGDMTLEQTGSFTSPGGGDSSMKSVRYQKGDKWRQEADMAMGGMGQGPGPGASFKSVTLFDGTDTWTLAMGMKTKLPKDAGQSSSSSPVYWSEPPAGSKISGEETIDGHECWIVELPANPLMPSAPRMWIDKAKFVNVRSESVLSGKTMRTDFSDFRDVKGVLEIPYHSDVYSNDQKTMTAEITKLETNTGLSDGLFDPAKLGVGPDGATTGTPAIDMGAIMKQAEEMQKRYGQPPPAR